MQGRGRIGKLPLQTPGHDPLRRSRPKTKCSSPHEAATAGVEIENTGSEPLVGLRYFGPDVHAKLPKRWGVYKQRLVVGVKGPGTRDQGLGRIEDSARATL